MKQQGKSKKKKFILIGAGTVAAGVLSYFGWQYWQDRKARKEEEQSEENVSFNTSSASANFVSPVSKKVADLDGFPLKKGSKGTKVKALQEALITKYGKSILPKYGADGDFGSEMLAALKKLSLPETIDESTFNVLVKGNTIDPNKVAESIFKATSTKNFNQVLFTLKGIRNTDEYAAVSEAFKNYRLSGVRQTLVNGLLSSFPDEKQKQQVRLEFTRMGLKYDGSKWSLSGIDGLSIITTEPAVVWKNSKQGFKVPSMMVLGTEIKRQKEYTVFENQGHKFLVKTQSIKYI